MTIIICTSLILYTVCEDRRQVTHKCLIIGTWAHTNRFAPTLWHATSCTTIDSRMRICIYTYTHISSWIKCCSSVHWWNFVLWQECTMRVFSFYLLPVGSVDMRTPLGLHQCHFHRCDLTFKSDFAIVAVVNVCFSSFFFFCQSWSGMRHADMHFRSASMTKMGLLVFCFISSRWHLTNELNWLEMLFFFCFERKSLKYFNKMFVIKK